MTTEAIKIKQDTYSVVTNTIIEQLEKGVIPWEKPFIGLDSGISRLPKNYTTGNKYRGVNILLLMCATIKHEYQTNEWASFKQWQTKGETVKKGEKGNLVVYYDTFDKEIEGETKKIPFLKTSWVFNRSQLQGYLPPELAIDRVSEVDKVDVIENFVTNTKAVIEFHKGEACYMPLEDKIVMPIPEQFITTKHCTATENYHAVLFHELTHWTGAKNRLQRINNKRFGDQNYATEELVAELGAAFLCADFGLNTAPKGNHAAYINSWLKALKENNRCILTVASEANKAVDYLHSFSPN